jgi:phospholipid N-methyltransferase
MRDMTLIKMNRVVFLYNFFLDFRIGTFAATPQKVVRRVCRRMDFSKDMILVEYGAGDGAFTRYLLRHMTVASHLIGIETNRRFHSELKKIEDERLISVNDDARNVRQILRDRGVREVDCVISGIPFSFMGKEAIHSIICDTWEMLKPSGKLIIYQFSPCVRKYLRRVFKDFSVRLEWGSPYYYVFEAWK